MEWLGSFEIPGTNQRVGGRLVISEGSSRLTTFDALVPEGPLEPGEVRTLPGPLTRVPMAWGFVEDGTLLTLVDLTSAARLPHGTYGSESWLVGFAIEGQLDADHPLTFSSVRFGLTHLSGWLSSPQPEEEWLFKSGKITISAERSQLVEVSGTDLSLTIESTPATRPGFDQIALEYPVVATASLSDGVEIEELVNSTVTPIEALVWVATGRYSDMSFWLPVETDPLRYGRLWVSLLKPRSHEDPARRLDRSRMLFNADDLPGGAQEGIERWLGRWDSLKEVLGPAIARQRAPFAYADDRFTTLVAALEEYSRQKHGDHSFSREERNKRIERVRNALAPSSPDLVEWVKEALLNAHRYSLRERLELLLDEAGSLAGAIAGDQVEEFIKSIVRSRNQVAHGLVRSGGIEGGASLAWTHRGLIWLLRYHMLIELGFPESDARTRVVENHEFKAEAKRLREELGFGTSDASE